MRKEPTLTGDPRIQEAVEELLRLIAGRYPDARFDVFERDDPAGVRLRATVDIQGSRMRSLRWLSPLGKDALWFRSGRSSERW